MRQNPCRRHGTLSGIMETGSSTNTEGRMRLGMYGFWRHSWKCALSESGAVGGIINGFNLAVLSVLKRFRGGLIEQGFLE